MESETAETNLKKVSRPTNFVAVQNIARSASGAREMLEQGAVQNNVRSVNGAGRH